MEVPVERRTACRTGGARWGYSERATDEVMGSGSARIQQVAIAVVRYFTGFTSCSLCSFTLTSFKLSWSLALSALMPWPSPDALVPFCLLLSDFRRAEDGPAAPAYLILRFAASAFGFSCMSTYRNPVPFRVGLRSLGIPLCLLRGAE